MISLISRRTAGRRLVLMFAGILLATNALAAQPVFDLQEQARQFILAKPIFGAAIDSKMKVVAVVSAHGNPRIDAQEQARVFIVGKPNFGDLAGRVIAPVSKLKVTQGAPARSNRGR